MRFEWDEAKNDSNRRKHGVDFLIAQEVFLDPLATYNQDRYVGFEERWSVVGMAVGRLTYVAFAVKEMGDEEVIRIISARRATRAERRHYERGT